MKAEMTIEKKTFRNREGREVEYMVFVATIFGEKINFEPKETDKKLLNFLLRDVESAGEEKGKEEDAGESIPTPF